MLPKFGTSGLRGLARDLTTGLSVGYTRAFARHLLAGDLINQGASVAIARDLRASSPEIASLCAQGLRDCGLKPVDCGQIPTPCLAYFAALHGHAAIMVTGSHIPEDRNGIKFYRPDGEISKIDEAAIVDLYEQERNKSSGISIDPAVSAINQSEQAENVFLERLHSFLPSQALKGLRVGVHEHSSVGRDILVRCLREYGAQVTSLARSDKFIAVDTEAVDAGTQRLLRSWTTDHKLDAIVSTDGDADRPMVADENGDIIAGDLIGLLTAEFLNATHIITPVTSNSGISTTQSRHVYRTKVGSPYVIAEMALHLSNQARVVGFEANGGVLVGSCCKINGTDLSPLPTRDCFLPILAVLGSAMQKGGKITKLFEGRNLPVTHADRLQDYPIDVAQDFIDQLTNNAEFVSNNFGNAGNIADVDVTDGLRMAFESGDIVHFRMSGNAPELRCYAEGKSRLAAQNNVQKALDVARRHLLDA